MITRKILSLTTRTFSISKRLLKDVNNVDFGYKSVPEDEKEELVGKVFSNVASKYDIMNDIMSGGIHRCWKSRFIEVLSPGADTKLLDVAGGTGDIAFKFLDAARSAGGDYSAKVTVCDINQNMLDVGKERAKRKGYQVYEIDWVCGNAEKLPFEDNSFDCFTIAFGIRNVTHIDKAISEAYRVLKPKGRFLCLEFSHVTNPLVKNVYDTYSFEVIPKLGQLVANDKESYQYLVESIRKFPPQPVFAQMMRDAGFEYVEWEDLTFGVAAIHSGWKKLD